MPSRLADFCGGAARPDRLADIADPSPGVAFDEVLYFGDDPGWVAAEIRHVREA